MANLIKAITTGVGGISTTADASGAITFQKDSTTTATIDASGNFAAAGNISTPTGTVTASSFVGNGSGLTGLASAQLQTQLFTAPGTWTKPASCTQVRVTVIGGGGGSAGGATSNSLTRGGWGGLAYAIVPVSAPVSVTVGSGGSGGGSSAAAGSPGGTSSFGALASATGGNGATWPGGNGATGSGSTTGTAIKLGSVIIGSFNGAYGNVENDSVNVPSAVTYSIPGTLMAGARGLTPSGFPTGAGSGGVSGAVIVEFVG